MEILKSTLLLLLLIPIVISTGGIFQLKIKYKSSSCSSSNEQSSCMTPTKLFICIKNYQINIDNLNCYIGSSWSNITTATGAAGSTTKDKQYEYNYEFKFRWTGTFSLIIEMWTEDYLIERVAIQKWLDINNEWKVEEWNKTISITYSYRVICLKNYYGKDCEKYCKARDDKFGHYYCELNGEIKCMDGWDGDYCEKAICLTNCSPTHGYCNKPNECICHNGWHGEECTECKQYPGCKNGKCIKQWECECYEGWGGLFCNQDLNYCTNHKPCRNSGICFNTGQGSYTCECSSGYSGIDCELFKDVGGGGGGVGGKEEERNNNINDSGGGDDDRVNCDDDDDDHGGKNKTSCLPPLLLLPPLLNNTNNNIIDFCTTHPCANGGTCLNTNNNKYTCKCPPPFSGLDCSCNCGLGSCDSNNICICPINYYGSKCELYTTAPTPGGGQATTDNFTLGMIKQIISNEEELSLEHITFIIISSISIPFLILFSISIIIIMRRRRLIEMGRLESIAKEQNEINTINNINKNKDLHIFNNIYKQNNLAISGSNSGGGGGGGVDSDIIDSTQDVGIEDVINERLERIRINNKNINYSYQPDSLDVEQQHHLPPHHHHHTQHHHRPPNKLDGTEV